MSRSTVIGNQNRAASVKDEHLPQGRFSGKPENAIRTNLVCKLVIRASFGWRTGKSDKQLRITFKQPPRKFDIT